LNKCKKPILLAVFLLGALVFLGSKPLIDSHRGERQGIWGGPSLKGVFPPETATAALISQPEVGETNYSQPSSWESEVLEPLGVVRGRSTPFGISGGFPVTYKVAKKDTLSGIARRFGISVSTLVAANPGVKAHSLRVGQELVILPTSGILYQSRPGDTLETIAASFKVDPAQIAEFNRPALTSDKLLPGTTVILPGIYLGDSKSFYENNLTSDYFMKPVEGWTSGVLHERNAVDIANVCGTPVAAAAEGLVLEVALGGWNGGYGSYVYLEHPNGTKTKYAHLAKVNVEVGDYLKRGEVLGAVGKSGEATGCHLHFEVEGAPNPFAKQYY
jgi:murein DD-endopeptidase MepM/ murein hydrolase activator NlpD